MNFIVPFSPANLPAKIQHSDKIMLVGSCFTEHIGVKMSKVKMQILQNPNGISFNPLSIAETLKACIVGHQNKEADLFSLNELWHNWQFHSRFSNTDKVLALADMNQSLLQGSQFIQQANWLIISFGSAFQYFLKQNDVPEIGVANCHKAPGDWFEKRMISIEEIVAKWRVLIVELRNVNPSLNLLFTVSPVKHLKDGVVENSRSKAILIEAVRQLESTFEHCHYFPAYEIVQDVLRDYRFYDKDLAHPNEQAVDYIWSQFLKACIEEKDHELIKKIEEIMQGLQHRPRFPDTVANKKFKFALSEKINKLTCSIPYLDFAKELAALTAN